MNNTLKEYFANATCKELDEIIATAQQIQKANIEQQKTVLKQTIIESLTRLKKYVTPPFFFPCGVYLEEGFYEEGEIETDITLDINDIIDIIENA